MTSPRIQVDARQHHTGAARAADHDLMALLASAAGRPATRRPPSASPVLIDWFDTWNSVLAHEDRPSLTRYVQPLAQSRGTTEEEVVRQWTVVDWALAHALPSCLHGAGLPDHAQALHTARRVSSPSALAAVAPLTKAAADAAHAAEEAGWRRVAALAHPQEGEARNTPPWRPPPTGADPSHVAAWGGLAEGTRAANQAAHALLRPAAAAVGYDRTDTHPPPTWQAADNAFRDGTATIGWAGTHRLVTSPDWTWRITDTDAWRAGYAAAGTALWPLYSDLYRSAHRLVGQLLHLT